MVRMSTNSEAVSSYRRRMKLLAIQYMGGKCVRCAYIKCVDALEFHHKDPTQKDFNIAYRGLTKKFETVKAELDKCMLVCANCHREIHAEIRATMGAVRGRQQRPWPDADSLRLLLQEKSQTQLAKELRVSRATMRHWCRVLGVALPSSSGRKFRNPQFAWPSDEYLRQQLEVKPTSSVAKELKVSAPAIRKRCKIRNIPTRPRGYWATNKSQ